jgi:shikimate dehydrogenase
MRKYGLIGFPLGHSFSGKYFSEKFARESIRDCSYSLFEIPSIGGIAALLQDPELKGLNVTIPYKQDVIPWLQEMETVVAETGACNCIRIEGGRLRGFNTDVTGFEQSLSELLGVDDRHALVFGTGGSSKAVVWVLRKLGIDFLLVSRRPSTDDRSIGYEQVDRQLLEQSTLLINTTPLGMTPDIHSYPPIPYEFLTPGHYLFDLVYNPAKTVFLQRGEKAGARVKNGEDMLRIQAEASWTIWNEVS